MTTHYQLPTTNLKGFTLIELILIISTAAVLFAGGAIALSSVLETTYLDTSASRIIQHLRLAQSRSISRYQNDTWGVKFDKDYSGTDDRIVLFKGTTYAGRDASWDIAIDMESIISMDNISFTGGGTDMVFTAVTGATATSGSVQVIDSKNNSHTLTINSYGIIDLS
jgi:Tfp pilus assembly protein FimT